MIRVVWKWIFGSWQNSGFDEDQSKRLLEKRHFKAVKAIPGSFPLFVFLRLLDFFYKVTFTITMQPGPIPVFAEIGGNIIPVQLKTRENKEPREIDR